TTHLQLLYEIHFYAASEALPLTSKRLHDIFKSAPPTVHADYLTARHSALPPSRRPSLITYALRFPLCTPSVLSALLSPPFHLDDDDHVSAAAAPELPRRLFRHLSTSGAEALPLLRVLYAQQQQWPDPDADSHDGYPLARAVYAGAVPLVRFLLDHGASPRRRSALSIRLAIKRRDLALVRMLVEPPPAAPQDGRRSGKRRRLADRVQVDSEMLKSAVTCGAHDIAEYLMNEKGCVPDLRTLSLL
ncbi:hypothetical protein BJV74DRAFT_759721, partial [Russula compacta]